MECIYRKVYCKTHEWDQIDFKCWNERMHHAFYGETKEPISVVFSPFLKFIGLEASDLSRDDLVQLLRQRVIYEANLGLKRIKQHLCCKTEFNFESDVESGFFLLKLIQYAKSKESFCEKELLGDFVLSEKVLYDLVVMSNDIDFETYPTLTKVWNIHDHIIKDVWNEIKFMWED